MIGPGAILRTGCVVGGEGDIELCFVQTILLKILQRFDGLIFHGGKVLCPGVSGGVFEFIFLFFGFVEKVLDFFH